MSQEQASRTSADDKDVGSDRKFEHVSTMDGAGRGLNAQGVSMSNCLAQDREERYLNQTSFHVGEVLVGRFHLSIAMCTEVHGQKGLP